MSDAVIVSATRTPIGRARKGSLVDARPDDLAAFAIDAALKQVPELPRDEVVDVMIGCGFPQDRQGMNLARRAALLADLPASVPGTTVNRFCASSLQTIRMAFHAIRAGEGDAFVAGGVESITQVDGYPKDSEELHPKLFGDDAPIANVYIPMGMTAENVAERWDVSREDMDRFAQRSQERAVAAQESGFFEREITPWDGVAKDDGPRAESTFEKLSTLEPAFKPGGKVTAGNSCPLNDGAAAVVVMSDTRAKELGLKPRARIIASAVSGVEPEIMGVGPIGAVRRVLEQAGMTIDDVDVMELNEAFAAQVLPVCRELGVDPFGEKLNPNGGAIALGHPYGMTGARIMCTLLNDLDTRDEHHRPRDDVRRRRSGHGDARRAAQLSDPILLIGGLGQGVWAWRWVEPQLARDHDVVGARPARDRRARGRAGAAERRRDGEDAAEHLDGRPAHVVGLSMGGYVSLTLALAQPELVRSLFLIGTGPGGPNRVPRPQHVRGGVRERRCTGAGRVRARDAAVLARAGLARGEPRALRGDHRRAHGGRLDARRDVGPPRGVLRVLQRRDPGRADRGARARRSTGRRTSSCRPGTGGCSLSGCRTRSTSSSRAAGTTCRSRSPTRSLSASTAGSGSRRCRPSRP